MTGGPWLPGEAAQSDDRRHAPATLRNRDAILDILRTELGPSGKLLEIASGSGEHALHFAAAMPDWLWQPSDADADALRSIAAWRADGNLPNLLPPLALAADQPWPQVKGVTAIFCANMVHIAPWSAAEGLMAGAGTLLPPGAPLLLYGPFIEPGVATSASNCAFDADLRARDARWGLRDTAALDALAGAVGLARTARHGMPANNLLLVWRKA